MEETSSNISPRKRKQFSSSSSTSLKPSMGPITRSKHRSGRAWTYSPSQKNIHQPRLIPYSSLKKPKSIHSQMSENGASLVLSIKDLRARARRVFSPTGSVEGQNGSYELGFDVGEEICNGSLKMVENSGNFELGFKSLDPGSGSVADFCVSDKEEENKLNMGSIDPGSKDLVPDMGNQGPPYEKDAGLNNINQVESGNDCCENQRNGSISSTRMVQKSCSRGKVYKNPSSFSYRRLLPFLTDMAKDDSCTLRIKIADEDCKVEDTVHVDSNASSVLTDSKFAEHEHIGGNSKGTRPSDEGPIQKVEIQLEVQGQGLCDPENGLPQNEEDVRSSNVEGRSYENGLIGGDELIEGYENGLIGGDELIEERIQTTPPDSTILSELDFHDTDTNGEVNNLKTDLPVLGYPSNGSTCSNNISIMKKCHTSPTRRNNMNSTTKLVLNPCSRSKIYKTSSSFSYRRLLPFLMDVAKSSSNMEPSPKFWKDVESSQHSVLSASLDNDMMLNKNEVCNFQEKQDDKSREPNYPTNINISSVDGSSDDICMKLSTPVFSSSSDISKGKSHYTCSENFPGPDTPNCFQMERTSLLHKHAQLSKSGKFEEQIHITDIRVCNDEGNYSAEASCSTVNHKSLPRESRLEVSQHQPVDIGKNCSPKDLVYHEGNVERIKSVALGQSSSKIGECYYQGTESPTKGILKRNPRGCRGLCNCLNCSSFRLHAERAFEFSRNQMLDAEEVALTLINELAELRDMLVKSAVDGSDPAAIQINQHQVRESCKKALEMEQQAKQRLIQMNDDLNAHCRITTLQRPRVTFSQHIEVKSIGNRTFRKPLIS